MRKLLATLALVLWPSLVWAQCAGVFPANTICGNNTNNPAVPTAVSFSGTISGPGPSVVGHFATWNNTIGTLLADFDLYGHNNVWTGTATFNGATSFTSTTTFSNVPTWPNQ